MSDAVSTNLLVVGACSRDTGGIAQYIRGQSQHIADSVDVTTHSTSSPPGKAALSEGGVAKYRWLLLAVLSAVRRVLEFPFYERPDVVHVHASSYLSFYRESVFVVFGALVWRRPVVVHIHGSDFDEFLRTSGLLRSWYVGWVLNLSAEVIVLSSYWEQVLCAETNLDGAMVLPNPIDVSSFSEDGRAEDPHIVYVSNLIERKGVAEFADAIRRLSARDGPEFRVSVAGDGPKSEQIRALAAEYEFVEYYGYVSESRKYGLLTDGSIYVLPTYAEGLPISLLEGMAGGNAVVSTEVGAIPEVVGSENGILIPPVDVDALVDALDTLRTDGQLRREMGETNRELVREQYTWTRISRELQELYERLRPRSQPGAGRTGGSPSPTVTSPK